MQVTVNYCFIYCVINQQVIEPTDKDKGLYSIVITDPENSHKRTLDLSGDGQYLLSLSVSQMLFYW